MSKIFPHVILASAGAMRWASRASGVKALDSVPVLQAAPADAIRVFRHWFPQQPLSADPRQVADTILRSLGGYRHPRLYVEACYNEIGRALTAEHGEMIAEVVRVLHGEGLLCCGPSWSTGDYDAEHWQIMRDHGWADLDAISVHCYWGNEGFTAWHALRYRQMWQPGDPPVLITECGRDRVEGGQGGWKRDGVTLAQYVAELRAYDALLSADSYVLGAMVFTCGPTPDWEYFNADEVGDMIMSNHTPYQFVLGFADLAAAMRARGLDPGQPTENEAPHVFTDGFQVTRQRTTTGSMIWARDVNQPLFAGQGRVVLYNGGNLLATVQS